MAGGVGRNCPVKRRGVPAAMAKNAKKAADMG